MLNPSVAHSFKITGYFSRSKEIVLLNVYSNTVNPVLEVLQIFRQTSPAKLERRVLGRCRRWCHTFITGITLR